MKRYDCSEDNKTTRRQDNKTASVARCLVVSLTCCLLLLSCVKHDEIEFAGKVIDVRICSSANIAMEQNPAYIVLLEYPASTGGIYHEDTNVIALYEPTTHIMVDDRIHGTFYLDDKYSKTSCSWHNTDYVIPEGVFTDVTVD